MKKSTILSLATAGAIVATSAFTFAAWDQTSITTDSIPLTFTEPKIVDVNTQLSFDKTILNGTDTEAVGTMKFDVSGTQDGDAIALSLVDNAGNKVTIPTGLDVTFTKENTDLQAVDGVVTDTSITNAETTYGVKVSVSDSITPTQAKALAESGFGVKVKAEIINKNNN